MWSTEDMGQTKTVIDGGTNPKFLGKHIPTHYFEAPNVETAALTGGLLHLRFEMINDNVGKDVPIGRASLEVGRYMQKYMTEPKQLKLPLEHSEDPAGTLVVELKFVVQAEEMDDIFESSEDNDDEDDDSGEEWED